MSVDFIPYQTRAMDLKLSDLKRVSKFRHISEYTPESLITGVGLYESVLIDTSGVAIASEDKTMKNRKGFGVKGIHVSVSKDVKALHKFLNSNDPITLPCPICGKDQPFKPLGWINGIDAINEADSHSRGIGYMKLYDPNYKKPDRENDDASLVDRLEYHFGLNEFELSRHNEFDKLDDDGDDFYFILALKCMEGIMHIASDFRRDYVCALNHLHRCSVGFVIEKAVENTPSDWNEDNEEAKKLYANLMHTLVMKKTMQYPSMADMQLFESRKYQRILKDNYGDYRRALGLYASGIGAGSFVYLRRIIESLVEEMHQECVKENSWDEEKYRNLRFSEKIEMLEKDYGKIIIPAELQPVRGKIYGVLSRGVHELSEDECTGLFLFLKDSIDMFLDEKIRLKEREARVKEINQRLQEE